MPIISDLSLTIVPATALYSNPVSDSVITATESTAEGRTQVVLDFNSGDGIYARDLGTAFSWPTGTRTRLYVWEPSLIEMPENTYQRPGDWMDGGTPGAKFIQGIIVEADSFNVAKTFQLQSSDDLSLHPLVEMGGGVQFNKQSIKAFSCVPFVAHSVRVVSTDAVAWRVWQSNIVFQPYPELTRNWTTEKTSLGMVGYGHIRELNIAHISTANLSLVMSFDQLPDITLTIPHSSGAYKKDKITVPTNKFKLVSFSLTSSAAFRVFEKDVELKVGNWGRSDAYAILRPFGGPSDVGAIL